MKKMKFNTTENEIVITIPIPLLCWAVEKNPESSIKKINDKIGFAKAMCETLKSGLGNSEHGLTGFEELLDEAAEDVSDNPKLKLILKEF